MASIAATRIASGDQRQMTILDPRVLVDIERYQRINIYAKRPRDVDPPPARLAVADNMGFLRQCIRSIETVTLAGADGEPYLRARSGRFEIVDPNDPDERDEREVRGRV